MTDVIREEARPRTGPFTGPPIFISGCNRGGTTILSRLLAEHPEVRNVGRGQFNEGQYVWRELFPDWSCHRWAIWPWRAFLRRTEAHAAERRLRYLRTRFEDAMEGRGRLLEKTPANAIRIRFIDRLYPDCTFVHIIRDGRHTTASLAARKVWIGYAPHQWVGAHRTALEDLKRIPAERVVLVRYEELVAHPEAVLAELCSRCGLSWGESERRAVLEQSPRVETPDDRWSRLTPRARRYVLRVIGDLQGELGYPLEA